MGRWGWVEGRECGAMKLPLYTLSGAVVALVGVLVMYFAAGSFFSDPTHLPNAPTHLALLRQPLGNPNAPAYSFDFKHFEVASRWASLSGGQAGPFDIA